MKNYSVVLMMNSMYHISRHIGMKREDIEKVKDLTIMAEGDAGVYIVANLKDNQFFITGVMRNMSTYSLKSEYDRDIKAGMDMHIPINYYGNCMMTKQKNRL